MNALTPEQLADATVSHQQWRHPTPADAADLWDSLTRQWGVLTAARDPDGPRLHPTAIGRLVEDLLRYQRCVEHGLTQQQLATPD